MDIGAFGKGKGKAKHGGKARKARTAWTRRTGQGQEQGQEQGFG